LDQGLIIEASGKTWLVGLHLAQAGLALIRQTTWQDQVFTKQLRLLARYGEIALALIGPAGEMHGGGRDQNLDKDRVPSASPPGVAWER
jgi:hypothetical protein